MDDLISRQAAIDALEEPCKVPDTWTDEFAIGERSQWEKDVKALNSLPSAERRGRWIHYAHREPLYDISGVKTWGEEYQCSNCGFIHSVIEDFGHYAYCPWCGANMDEVDE